MKFSIFLSSLLVLITACGAPSDETGSGDEDSATQSGTVRLTLRQSEHGTIAASPSGPYQAGAVVTITATPEQGYGFAGWTGIDKTSNPATITLDENTTVSASFVEGAVSLLASASPAIGGEVTVSPAPPYKVGDKVTVTAESAFGYSFEGWQGTSSSSPSYSVTLTNDTTVVAEFARIPAAVNVTSVAGADTSVSPAGAHYVGDSVTVSVTAQDGWVFDGWSDGNKDDERVITLNGDTTLTPRMVAVPWITGPATVVGNERQYVIVLRYAGASLGGYAIEEAYKGAGFTAFANINVTETVFNANIDVDRDPGQHCYRARARSNGQLSPYGNTFCLNRQPGPKRIAIINDLATWRDVQNGNELNDIVRVHASPNGVNVWNTSNYLRPTQQGLPGNVVMIGRTSSFDTSGMPANYQFAFGAGYWDHNCITPGSCFWEAHQTTVTGCDGRTMVNKNQALNINDHTYDTIFIRTSDWLPRGNYGACSGGSCQRDPVCD